ncbi:uncharacterized protein [Heterodontus francisci]|uniref:uncharacterized protein n=1 Tax=Heterodontus francisci TaxID=7792 RepID=UPI00355B4242
MALNSLTQEFGHPIQPLKAKRHTLSPHTSLAGLPGPCSTGTPTRDPAQLALPPETLLSWHFHPRPCSAGTPTRDPAQLALPPETLLSWHFHPRPCSAGTPTRDPAQLACPLESNPPPLADPPRPSCPLQIAQADNGLRSPTSPMQCMSWLPTCQVGTEASPRYCQLSAAGNPKAHAGRPSSTEFQAPKLTPDVLGANQDLDNIQAWADK